MGLATRGKGKTAEPVQPIVRVLRAKLAKTTLVLSPANVETTSAMWAKTAVAALRIALVLRANNAKTTHVE
jgi:hypothetical protein